MTLLCRLSLALCIGVAALGCERDKTDDFAIKQPVVRTQRGPVKLTEMAKNYHGTMALSDPILFNETPSPGLTLRAVSSCRYTPSGDQFQKSTERPFASSISLYQLIDPKSFYVPEFKSGLQLACSFQFWAINQNQSQHLFNLPVQIIDDPGLAIQAQLKQNTEQLTLAWVNPRDELSPEQVNALVAKNEFSKLEKYLKIPVVAESDLHLLTVSLPEADLADLRCSSFSETIGLKNNLAIDLRSFNWARNEKEGIQKRWKRELCRVVGYNKFGVTAVSPYFYVNSVPPKFSVTRVIPPILPYLGEVRTHFPGKAFVYQSVSIKNETVAPIQVSLPQVPTIEVQIVTRPLGAPSTGAKRIAMPQYKLSLQVPNEKLENGTTISIAPKQTKTIDVLLPAFYECLDSDNAIGVVMTINFDKQGPPIAILDGTNQPFETIPVLAADPNRPLSNILPTTSNFLPSMLRNFAWIPTADPQLCRQLPTNPAR